MKGVYTASAPGSLMLFGEHAVLHGHAALVAAVDRRVTVTLRPRRRRKKAVHAPISPPPTMIVSVSIGLSPARSGHAER